MKRYRTKGSVAFDVFNHLFLAIAALICIFPIINVLAISFSSSTAAASGKVGLLPIEWTTASYKYALGRPQFRTSFLVSVKRVIIALFINTACMIFSAYPLSMEKDKLWGRTVYSWIFFLTMIINGGLIPWYITIRQLNLLDSIWALILPGAVPVFSVIILLNFFRQLPKELSESASIDGANHFQILFRIYLPLSIPSLATVTLFTIVGHWNEWFHGMILMTDPKNYPLQTYLQSVVAVRDTQGLAHASRESLEMLSQISDRTLKSSQIFIAALPVMLIYPFMQKYFMKGLVIGSVKG